ISIVALVGAGVAVYFGLSRTSYALLVVAAIAALLMMIWSRSRRLFYVTVGLGLSLLVIVLVVGFETWLALLAEIDGARSGSSRSRGSVYSTTWAYVGQHPFPLIGYGIKPSVDGLVASVGSLSTYLGMLFKAGTLGLGLFVALLVSLAWK